MDKGKATQSPMERYNCTLIEQINEQLQRGFKADLQADGYYVIKTGVDGVLSVLGSAMVGDKHAIVFGPKSFAACIEYVNVNLAARVATDTKSAHAKHGDHHDGRKSHGRVGK